jgi:trimethylamine--corrinoid protein Co-methyltransferase
VNTFSQEITCRPGVIVHPLSRISKEQIQILHRASMEILKDPGIMCFNEEAVSIFDKAGCHTTRAESAAAWIVKIPEKVIKEAIASAPSQVILGASDPANKLILDAQIPRIYFGTGSETNIFLETDMHDFKSLSNPEITLRYPVYRKERGTLARLCDSARLCNSLSNVDFFIRNVNVQDEEITENNKDVNVFVASLLYLNKHVQAGLTSLDALDSVVRIGEIVAGGKEAFENNKLLSFIACVVKSPLQIVEDTAQKVIEIARRGLPLVISSSPQGGTTAPVQEEGMVSLINAEILSGIALTQLVNPGAPVLYGAVPVRARLDNLHDLYGTPEFIHYNIDCVQMARSYNIPCYSTAGVGDSKIPGIQSTVEKLFSQLAVAQSGAQYIHYAFGLLDKTNIFSPVQALMDNASIALVKQIVRTPIFDNQHIQGALDEIQKVMASSTRLFARYIRKHMRKGFVSPPYEFEGERDYDSVIAQAHDKLEHILAQSGTCLSDETINNLYNNISGLLPRKKFLL